MQDLNNTPPSNPPADNQDPAYGQQDPAYDDTDFHADDSADEDVDMQEVVAEQGAFDLEKDREDRLQARRMIRSASRFSYIGIEFVVAPTFCFFVGKWLDGYFGTSPILKISLTILGVATAIYDLVRLSRNAKREMERPSS